MRKGKKGRIGILTGGGDVPGLNPAIRAVTVRAVREGYDVVGIRRGWGGLVEIAEASRVGLFIEKDRIPVQNAIARVCELFAIDPYTSISEGTLLATCRPHRADELVRRLEAAGIVAAIIGEVRPPEKGCTLRAEGREQPLRHPRVDPFWQAFGKAASEEQARE